MKVARHEKIIELIHQYDIDTQEELASRLNEAGFKVTQATVSRDIRALKLTKVAGKDAGKLLATKSRCSSPRCWTSSCCASSTPAAQNNSGKGICFFLIFWYTYS